MSAVQNCLQCTRWIRVQFIYVWCPVISFVDRYSITWITLLASRSKMRKKTIRKKTLGWQNSPGGSWSQTGAVMRSQRSRSQMTTDPLSEAPTTTFCWSQQVSSDIFHILVYHVQYDTMSLMYGVGLCFCTEIAWEDSKPQKCVCTNMAHLYQQ